MLFMILDLLDYIRIYGSESAHQFENEFSDILVLLILDEVSNCFEDTWEVEVGFHYEAGILNDADQSFNGHHSLVTAAQVLNTLEHKREQITQVRLDVFRIHFTDL